MIPFGGTGRIRTRDAVSRMGAYQAPGFSHSPTVSGDVVCRVMPFKAVDFPIANSAVLPRDCCPSFTLGESWTPMAFVTASLAMGR